MTSWWPLRASLDVVVIVAGGRAVLGEPMTGATSLVVVDDVVLVAEDDVVVETGARV